MTPREGAGAVATPAETGPDASLWAPMRRAAFRWLWIGVLVSNMGIWMQTVGAQWLLVDAPNAAALVSLVQAANALPVMLLAFPAGVLADSFDRRWLLISVQAYVLIVGSVLAVLTFAGQTSPTVLLVFTFLLGAGVAVQLPCWQAIIPELLPRNQLRSGARLDMINVNLARSVGPALAGLVIAYLGVPFVFALNALSGVLLAIALLFWHRRQTTSEGGRERFVPALRAGRRYVWHEPVVRRVLLRTALFIAPAMALWALLPLIATERLGLGAAGYGALFAALGVGAIVGAVVVGPARSRLTTNGIIGVASTLYAAALASIVLVPNLATGLGTLVLAGLAWTALLSTMNAELQLFMPSWVRARGLAAFMVTFTGTQAAAAVLWGVVAERVGLLPALLLAAGVLVATVVAGVVWPVADNGNLDRDPAVYWAEARLAIDPEPDTGPVMVTVDYTITPERKAPFLTAMDELRRSRLRTGATRWELYQDGDQLDHFTETFRVSSWQEHVRQHTERLTAADKVIEEAALVFSDPPPRARHLLPPHF